MFCIVLNKYLAFWISVINCDYSQTKKTYYTFLPFLFVYNIYIYMGAKGNWDFQISYLVKNPDRTDI